MANIILDGAYGADRAQDIESLACGVLWGADSQQGPQPGIADELADVARDLLDIVERVQMPGALGTPRVAVEVTSSRVNHMRMGKARAMIRR